MTNTFRIDSIFYPVTKVGYENCVALNVLRATTVDRVVRKGLLDFASFVKMTLLR